MRIKFVMSDKSETTLDRDKAEAVLQSPDNIVMVSNDRGEWSGVTINKSFLVRTAIDFEVEEGVALPEDRQLEETKPDAEAVGEALDELREKQPWLIKDVENT